MNRDELWGQIRQGLRDGIQYTVQKTEELTKVGRLKLEIASQKRRIGRRVADLGARVYDLLSEVPDSHVHIDEQVLLLVDQLKQDEAKLVALETELESVKAPEEDEIDIEIDAEEVADELYKPHKPSTAPEAGEDVRSGQDATVPGVDQDPDNKEEPKPAQN